MNYRFFYLLLCALADPDKRNLIEFYEAQIEALRAQAPKRLKFTPSQKTRMGLAAKILGRKVLLENSTLVTPETLFRWYRRAVREKWTYSTKPGPGRPRIDPDVEKFILQFAAENKGWGYTTLRKALETNQFTVSESTIKTILKRHGLTPAPSRKKQLSWKEFFAAHWDALVGCDFFTWEVLTPFGLSTHYVFFLIRHSTREVHIAGITTNPNMDWMKQIAKNLTLPEWGWLKRGQILLHDRDGKFQPSFKRILQNDGIRTLAIPFRSPNLNAYAERWVRSVKEECLSKLIIMGEPMLRNALKEYVKHYHQERNHQGLDAIPFPGPEVSRGSPKGRVQRRQRLGGILNYYYREDAA